MPPPARRGEAARLAAFFHHRWAAPVLAELERSRGARFSPLARRLGVGRDSLRRTVDALLAGGWARRNPGHGHPLRPEYVTTPAGARLGRAVGELLAALRAPGLEDAALRKWWMPLVHAIGPDEKRFSELLQALPGLTPRALALALRDLDSAGLLRRVVVGEWPPRSAYRLTAAGRRLVPVLREVARAVHG
jgi:DNA-binding HxlR family transcriptional regulator